MPTYEMRNKETGEIFDIKMSYKDLDQYFNDNPHIERYHSAENLPIFSDGVRMNTPGTGKPDSAFEKYVINRIAETVPGNTIKKTHKTRIPKEF